MEDANGPTGTQTVLSDLEERLRELATTDPFMAILLSRDRHELRFWHGGTEMVLIGVDRSGLAHVARALRLARVRRRGRRGDRTWDITLRPIAEQPKSALPLKHRKRW